MIGLNDVVKYDPIEMINQPLYDVKLRDKILSYPKKFKILNRYGRLDVIANVLYNNVDLWFILAIYNYIENPFDISNYNYLYYIPKDDLIEIVNSVR
jgi:hypothetical protein